MKKLLRLAVLFLLIGLLLILGGSLALALYYRNNFPVNTWINGVYCTGKTVRQVNEELAAGAAVPQVTLLGQEGQSWQLDLTQAEGRADYTGSLKKFLRRHASAFWIEHLRQPVTEEVPAACYLYNENKLKSIFDEAEPVRKERETEEGVSLSYSAGEGYRLVDGNSDRLDMEKAFHCLKECLSKGETVVDLVAGGCYVTLEDSPRDRAGREMWKLLEAFFAWPIVYDMGAEKISLTPDILSRFVAADASGVPALDDRGLLVIEEDRVRAWVEELADAYDTVGKTISFPSTRGDLVEVKYDTYGTELDVEAEVAYLMEALGRSREEAEIHVPAYRQEAFARGLDDIGGTYIEVDMTQQHMYYYVDHELALDTDVVTGNTGRRMGTPQGINFVYNKQKNRVLRGPGYATPVKYWMPVRGNVGIHDAGWRSEFGGEIYKKNGSHGCINTPGEKMALLYDMVEIGTPVILFY